MDDQDRRWPARNLRGASRSWSEMVKSHKIQPKAPATAQRGDLGFIDMEKFAAEPLPEKWQGWLTPEKATQ